MEKLQVFEEYKFVKGGSSFYLSIGDKVKFRLKNGDITEGKLMSVFRNNNMIGILTEHSYRYINFDDMIDAMPM